MKKIIYIILSFVVGLIAIDLLFACFCKQIYAHSGQRFAKLYNGKPINADVLVMGNSRAVNTFNVNALTEKTGLKWFNLGYNGMGPILVEALLYDYLEKNNKPKLVVFEVSNIGSGTGALRDVRQFATLSKRLAELSIANNGFFAKLATISSLLSCNSEAFFRVMNYIGKDDQDWVNAGKINPIHATQLKEAGSRKILEDDTLINASAALAYKRMFEMLQRNNIKYHCVLGPYFLNDEAIKCIRESVVPSLCETKELIDLSNILSDVRYFADPVHINREGRDICVEIIANLVK